jgi:hypothetical protein
MEATGRSIARAAVTAVRSASVHSITTLATRFELRHMDSILADLGDTQRQNVLPALAGEIRKHRGSHQHSCGCASRPGEGQKPIIFDLLDVPGAWAFFVAPDAPTWIDGAPALFESVRKHRRQQRELTIGPHWRFLAVPVATCVTVLGDMHWRDCPRLHATKESLEVYGLGLVVGARSRRLVGAVLG